MLAVQPHHFEPGLISRVDAYSHGNEDPLLQVETRLRTLEIGTITAHGGRHAVLGRENPRDLHVAGRPG